LVGGGVVAGFIPGFFAVEIEKWLTRTLQHTDAPPYSKTP